jgi:hypothetical protein
MDRIGIMNGIRMLGPEVLSMEIVCKGYQAERIEMVFEGKKERSFERTESSAIGRKLGRRSSME